jgi:hypothetical protein
MPLMFIRCILDATYVYLLDVYYMPLILIRCILDATNVYLLDVF